MIELSEQQIMDELVGRLAGRYAHVDRGHVSRLVEQEYARFEGRPIRDFIPLFVERSANDELAKLSI